MGERDFLGGLVSWWDDVKFAVTEQGNAVQAAGQVVGQAATGAALGDGGFTAGSTPGAAVSAVSSGSGSAGTISMSRDEMEDTLRRARDLLEEINNQRGPAERLTAITAPAHDPGSVAATDSANNGGKYYVGHLQRQAAYLNKVIGKMQDALGYTVQVDEDNRQTLQNIGGEGAYG